MENNETWQRKEPVVSLNLIPQHLANQYAKHLKPQKFPDAALVVRDLGVELTAIRWYLHQRTRRQFGLLCGRLPSGQREKENLTCFVT